MSRRIEVELTSERDDGTWTWRAAGARQPKGTLAASLLYEGVSVGDVVRADAEFHIDGIDIIAVLPPKGARKEPERIELLAPRVSDDQLVTTTLAPKGRGRGRRDRDGRRERRPRGGGEGRTDRSRRERRPDTEGAEKRPRRERRSRPAPPPVPERPKAKRLRPLRHHRNGVLADLPEAERPIAEQVLRGGVPAVRQAVEKQNSEAATKGLPTIPAEPLIEMAERLLPRLRTAEWRDRADAALATLDELDLRDLRSVVVASDSAARDDETRELAAQLREGLNRRVEEEHRAWMTELHETLEAGRIVRALRLSSRPPKAGAPLPTDMATRLAEAASAAFGGEVTQERWATVLDAVAYSPVRQNVTPAEFPAEPSDELLAAVRKLASRVPTIAAHFGIEPTQAPAKGRRRGASKAKADEPKADEPKADEPKAEAAVSTEAATTETPAGEPTGEAATAAPAPAAAPEAESQEPKATVPEPDAEEPKAEEPKATEPKAEEPKTEAAAPEEPKVEETAGESAPTEDSSQVSD